MPSPDGTDMLEPAHTETLSAIDYYRDPAIRARMLEACGSDQDGRPTAAYVAGLGEPGPPHQTWAEAVRIPVDQIATLWARGVDISRSLWDAKQLLFMLELDYLNVDQPAEPYLRPAEVFVKLEPAYRAVRREFRQLGLSATHPDDWPRVSVCRRRAARSSRSFTS